MDIQLENQVFSPLLQRVLGVVERRTTLPILGYVQVMIQTNSIRLTGTDLELQIQAFAPIDQNAAGVLVVPARKLADICRALPSDCAIRLRAENDRLTITALSSRFSLLTLPSADFPIMEVPETTYAVEMTCQDLRTLLDKTAFAMAQGDVRYYLNGLLLTVHPDSVTCVATDGHRLAKVRREFSTGLAEPVQIILPTKTVQELRRLLTTSPDDDHARIEISDRTFCLETGQLTVASKIVDGRYPDYERVIPVDATQIALINRGILRDAVARASVLSTDKYKGARLTFHENRLRIQAQNPESELAEEDLTITYNGAETTIGFNLSYVLDVLGVIAAEEVQIHFIDADTSTIWRGKNIPTETFVIMPMRL